MAQSLPYENELPNFNVAKLKHFMIGGRRLKPPDMAPHSMYTKFFIKILQVFFRQKLMSSCWSVNPQERPSFTVCQSIIQSIVCDARGETVFKRDFYILKIKNKLFKFCSLINISFFRTRKRRDRLHKNKSWY
jgi:hypothetical protein